MRSAVTTESFTINQADILYVAQRINLDLLELSRFYPDKLSYDKAAELFNSYTIFLLNAAITRMGFSLYDPADDNRVYLEYRYELLYGGDMRNLRPDGRPVGRGERQIKHLVLPPSVKFISWVVWSPSMLGLPISTQEQIVAGTGWSIPSRGNLFEGRYVGGARDASLNLYARG